MNITPEVLILASALGGGGVGPTPPPTPVGPTWPYIREYDTFLSVDDGVLNTHDDTTGGITVIDPVDSSYKKNKLTNAGWVVCAYNIYCRIQLTNRIDLTNVKSVVLQATSNPLAINTTHLFRVEVADSLDDGFQSSSDGEVYDGNRIIIDVSQFTGYKYFRVVGHGDNTSINSLTISKIFVTEGPYVYRYGTEVKSLTGGWDTQNPLYPAASNSEKREDCFYAYQPDTQMAGADSRCAVTKDMIKLSAPTSMAVTFKTSVPDDAYPRISFYDSQWVSLGSIDFKDSSMGYNTVGTVTKTIPAGVVSALTTGGVHIGMSMATRMSAVARYVSIYAVAILE